MTLLRSLQSALLIASLGVTGAAAGEPWRGTSAVGVPAGAEARQITFNGRPATPQELQILARFEAAWGAQVPSGAYWYDNRSGAAGAWGGPTRGFLGAGLGLGGAQVPANASGGGAGALTGVFINGRELHPLDVQGLTTILGQAPAPGRWWVDGAGNFGPEGYGPLGNLQVLAAQRQRGRGGGSYWRPDNGKGGSTFVGRGCASVTQRRSPSDPESKYTTYVGCE